ncbi:MAG: LysR family transcriptional regulator [Methylococcus sp.]
MSDLRQFDLNLLVAFEVLMREMNVSRAAEKMFVTQSTMSHILQRLRQQLDDPVLVRTNTGMKPTERALALVEPVRAILREVERVIQVPERFEPGSSQRRFVIAATDYMEFLLIPPLIERIGLAAPGVDITSSARKPPSRRSLWKAAIWMWCWGFRPSSSRPLSSRSKNCSRTEWSAWSGRTIRR